MNADKSLLCPLCGTELKHHSDGVLSCVNKHGMLMTGNTLHNGLAQTANALSEKHAPNTSQPLHCPNCSEIMAKVNYDFKDITIDSCPACPYRWLDSGELQKIVEYKPSMSAEQLLFVQSLESELAESDQDTNVSIPGTTPLRTGLMRQPVSGILTLGLSGLVLGMVRSKQTRRVVLACLAVLLATLAIVFIST